MGYFRAPCWSNLIIRSSFSHLLIKRFSIPSWMACIMLAVYSISVLRFQQYFKSVIYCFLADLFQYLFLDFSYVLIGERRFQIL
jgi:hypothetical protein